MSDRGSFTTEYIYCDKCLEVAKEHLVQNYKYLKGVQIPGWQGEDDMLPIIAGKIGSIGNGDTYMSIVVEADGMINKLCHTLRISVIPENGNPEHIVIEPESKKITCSWEDNKG